MSGEVGGQEVVRCEEHKAAFRAARALPGDACKLVEAASWQLPPLQLA